MLCQRWLLASLECVLCTFGQMLKVVSGWGWCRGAEWSLVQVGPCWVPWAGSWLGRKCGRLWGIPSTVGAETEQLQIRVWSLIWEEASRNSQGGSVLSDICVISDVASHEQRGLGWEQSDTAYRRGLIPPSLFLGGDPLEGVLPVCMGMLPLYLCEWQTGSGWKRVAQKAPGPCWALLVLPANVSPFLIPCWQLGLALGQQQQALLPACCGEHEAQMAQLEFDQNVLKAFLQIVTFNFNKSYLVALRTLAVWGERVMSWKKLYEWVLCEGLLRVWCGVRGITSSFKREGPLPCGWKHGGVDKGSTLTEKCSFRLNNKILHAHTD